MKVGVVGASGYGGIELVRLLEGHGELQVAVVAADRAAGSRLADVAPSLAGSRLADAELAATSAEAVAGCDLVFLATPASVSMALAGPAVAAGARVVDLSGAFRLPADAYERWYGAEHAAPDATPAVYGLPELFRAEIAEARLVAGPGCYPTASLLALVPLTGLVDPATVTVVGLSGVSGAGRGLREDLHAAHVLGSVGAYAAPSHRHTPEIEDVWARAAAGRGVPLVPRVTFVPHLVPTARGLVATATAAMLPEATGDDVLGAVADAYARERFVTVLRTWPASGSVVGGNAAQVHVAVDERSRRVVVSCAIDNLIKGAAGQAVQAANVMCGLDEHAGLSALGVYP